MTILRDGPAGAASVVCGCPCAVRAPGMSPGSCARIAVSSSTRRGSGIDAELVGQQGSRPTRLLERLRLPAVSVQRQHQAGADPLSEWVRLDEGTELRDIHGLARCEIRVDPVLDRLEPELFEAIDLGAGESSNAKSASGAPRHSARASFSDMPASAGSFAARGGPSTLSEALEAVEIEGVGGDLHDVAGLAPGDRDAFVAGEQLPELRDVDLEAVIGAGRCLVAPEPLDELVHGAHAPVPEQQHRQERPGLPAAERERTTLLGHFEGTEDLELHTSSSGDRDASTHLRRSFTTTWRDRLSVLEPR